MKETEPPNEGGESLPLYIRLLIRVCYPKKAEAEGYEDCVSQLTATTLAQTGCQRKARRRMHKETFLACFPVLARHIKNIIFWLFIR